MSSYLQAEYVRWKSGHHNAGDKRTVQIIVNMEEERIRGDWKFTSFSVSNQQWGFKNGLVEFFLNEIEAQSCIHQGDRCGDVMLHVLKPRNIIKKGNHWMLVEGGTYCMWSEFNEDWSMRRTQIGMEDEESMMKWKLNESRRWWSRDECLRFPTKYKLRDEKREKVKAALFCQHVMHSTHDFSPYHVDTYRERIEPN